MRRPAPAGTTLVEAGSGAAECLWLLQRPSPQAWSVQPWCRNHIGSQMWYALYTHTAQKNICIKQYMYMASTTTRKVTVFNHVTGILLEGK